MSDSQLIEHRLLDEHAFLLLDMAHAKDGLWCDLPGRSVTPKKLVAEADSLPRLVATDELDAAHRQQVLEALLAFPTEESRPVAALFVVKATPEQLADHLRAQMIVSIPKRGRHLFRYYDPRVFRHLLWMAKPVQLATLFGSVKTWTWCDAEGLWRQSPSPRGVKPSPSFHTDDLDLARIGVLERCLKTLRKSLPDFVDDPDNVQARRVNALLDEAFEHGLADEADLRLYVTQALQFHPSIHGHPELTRRLQSATTGDSYVGACSDLDIATLTACASDMSRARKEHV